MRKNVFTHTSGITLAFRMYVSKILLNLQFSMDRSVLCPKTLRQLIHLKWKNNVTLNMNTIFKVAGLLQQEL